MVGSSAHFLPFLQPDVQRQQLGEQVLFLFIDCICMCIYVSYVRVPKEARRMSDPLEQEL